MDTLTADARLKQRITDESLYRQVCWDSIHTLLVVVGGELPLCLDFNKGDFVDRRSTQRSCGDL